MWTRGKLAIAAAGLVATGGLVVGSQASGQPTGGVAQTGGVVHFYEYFPPKAVPGRVILTGAIFDHGLDRGNSGPNHTYDMLVLTKGSFEVNLGKIKSHQHLDTKSCTLVVRGSGSAPIVKGSGTGAYQGITGTGRAQTGFTGVFPKKPNGSCNMDAPPETGWGFGTGVARVSLG